METQACLQCDIFSFLGEMIVDLFAKIVLDKALSGSNLYLAELSAFADVLANVARSLDLLLNTLRQQVPVPWPIWYSLPISVQAVSSSRLGAHQHSLVSDARRRPQGRPCRVWICGPCILQLAGRISVSRGR